MLLDDCVSAWLRRLGFAPFILVLLVATYVVVLPFYLIADIFPGMMPGKGAAVLQSSGLAGRFIWGSIIAPSIETALFQWVPIRFLRMNTSVRWHTIIAISAGLFAASHWYSLGYICVTFFVGLVLAYGFAVRSEPMASPFVLVFVVHGLRNGIATLFQ